METGLFSAFKLILMGIVFPLQIRVVNAFKTGMDHRQRTMNIISPAVFNSLVGPLGTGLASSTNDDEPTTPTATLVDTVDGQDGNGPVINRIETNF